jgi:hypothetical protein
MTKHDQQDKKKHRRAAHIANITDGDWGSLFEQLSGVIDWALDIAARLSRRRRRPRRDRERPRLRARLA